MKRLALPLAVVLVCGVAIIAQSVDPAMLLKPPVDSWPTYHGDYSGQRHSKLTAITPGNVNQLTLAWAFATNQTQQIKGTPILVNGVIYLTTPDNIWAVDGRTARQLWRYTYPPNDAFHIGHRGAAVYKDSVFLTTPDAHLVALDARTGAVKWDVMIADAKRGFWSTNAPLLIRNHLIVGVAGDFDNLPGTLKSFDPDTGKVQWTFYSTPPPGTPDSISGGATGGQMWMTGTYDPDLNLFYVGTGNPTPVLNGEVRPGDNAWTCSIVALNPDTGKLAWGFQASPHDTHDWDASEVPVLVDGSFNGSARKLLLQASRNGYFFVLDRTTGKSLLTVPFAAANWAKGIDKDGRPIPNSDKEPLRDGRLVAPNEAGATNYRSPSFDPRTGLLLVSAVDAYGIYFFKKEHGAYGWAGANSSVWSKAELRAIEYQTGKIKWTHELGDGAGGAGVLTTESGLTFTGDNNGNVMALRTSDGTTLWHSAIGRVGNSPITYELDGRQYIVFGGGSSLYAFALPESARQTPPATAGAAAPPTQGGRGGGPVKSPEVAGDRRVTFRLRAPNASDVAVSLGGKQLPMHKDEQGIWSMTTDALAPDIYTYALIVDGDAMNDPSNRQAQTSFIGFQSMFAVPGPGPWLPAPAVERGAIARHPFHSAVANDDRDFFVYTPPGYDARREQPYPVLYLLHGLGDDSERWMNGGAANNILDNLIAQGKAVPMIVVSPLGYGTSNGPTGGRTPENITGYTKILLEEVMPVVDKAYNVSRNREQRAIAGLSMGGAESLFVGLNHLDQFAWIGAFSSAPMLWPATAPAAERVAGVAPQPMDVSVFAKTFPGLDAKANSQLRMLWIVCGTADGLIGVNRQFKDWLRSKGVQFTEQEVSGMGHVWPLWRQNLTDMVPKLFQPKRK